MHCQVCKHNKRTYKILLNQNRTIIDAEWVLRFFGTTNLVAKADRMQNWTDQQRQVVAIDDVRMFVHKRWHGRDKPENYRIGTWDSFQDGMKWDGHVQCERHRGEQEVKILIVDQEEMFNG
jgi:hypothetical protein